MYQEKITILRHLQERGGSLTVQNFVELGLTDKAFGVAVQSLSRLGLVAQDGLTQEISFGAPVSLSLTKVGTSAIKETWGTFGVVVRKAKPADLHSSTASTKTASAWWKRCGQPSFVPDPLISSDQIIPPSGCGLRSLYRSSRAPQLEIAKNLETKNFLIEAFHSLQVVDPQGDFTECLYCRPPRHLLFVMEPLYGNREVDADKSLFLTIDAPCPRRNR
jgi:hypothetical protein